ncbi:MAG: hypothetical protein WCP55_16820, partial [Lentisphaerota bacterium]
DRNYFPGQETSFQLYLFNNTHESVKADVAVSISDGNNHVCDIVKFSDVLIEADSTIKKKMQLKVPSKIGHWRFEASVKCGAAATKHPVVSSWNFRTMEIVVPEILKNKRIKVPEYEKELSAFFKACGIDLFSGEDADSDIFIGSAITWERLLKDICFKTKLNEMLDRRCSVLLLDAGPIFLGREYPVEENGLPQRRRLHAESIEEVEILKGLKISFTPFNEPESCIHPTAAGKIFWENMDRQCTSIWNGLRGGLIVPAVDMNMDGLSPRSFLELWMARGADETLIIGQNYFAYELGGHYDFSIGKSDKTENALREKLRFLVEDSPSLKLSINPEATIKTYNLSEIYINAVNNSVSEIVPLSVCGKDLKRTPVFKVSGGNGKSNLIVSQLIMQGRLAPGFCAEGLYGVRIDPSAQQILLNMTSTLLAAIKTSVN